MGLKNYRQDGTLFYNELHLSTVYNEAGEITHYMGVQNDVTTRVRQQRNLRRAPKQTCEDSGWLNKLLAKRMLELDVEDAPQIDKLTPRDNELLVFLAQGSSNADIAGALNVSVNTVRNHLRAIYKKLGLSSRLEVALWAKARGYDES